MRNSRKIAIVAALVVATGTLAVLSGCASTAPAPVSTPDILTRTLPADVSAQGVVLAAVMIKIADVQQAVTEGLVTPAEVEEARKALEAGTLNLWEQRAEAE